MPTRSPLEDPRNSAHAWARFRKMMKLMAAVTGAVVLLAMVLVFRETGFASPHLYLATALGIGVAMLLTGFLMGLVFLSHGTGHDDTVSHGEHDDRSKN